MGRNCASQRDGLTARRGPEKAWRGLKVQRGPNFKFNFGRGIAKHGPEKVKRGR